MKKTITAVVAALAMLIPASLRAEEATPEYNMVITLQNGTTITLGHNDIKNITFNGEEIEISGNVVNTISELDEKAENALQRTYMLEEYVDASRAEMMDKIDLANEYLNQLNSYIQYKIDEVRMEAAVTQQSVSALELDVQDLKDKSDMTTDRLINLENNVAELRGLVGSIMSQLGM